MAVPENGSNLPQDTTDPLAHEAKIVWLDESAKQRPYVRESLVFCSTRAGAPPRFSSDQERAVAYSTLSPGSQRFNENGFLRRVFSLRPQDTDARISRSMAPSGAVNPQTLAPGRKGDFVRLTALDSPSNNSDS